MSSLAQPPGVPTGPHLDNRRIAAALIDLVVPLAVGAAAYAAGLSMTKGLALVAVGWTLYYFFALESGDGQTLGKRVMKLRVVSADGSPATMEQIAKRTVVRILDGHIVGLIVMLATGERRQRLGDIVAGTVVTEAGPVVAPLSEAQAGLGPEPELPGDPSNEPARRTLRKPSFPRPALGRLSLGGPAARGSASETSPRKLSLGLPALRPPWLRKPSLRKRTNATERSEPTRESSPAATPTPVAGVQPTVGLGDGEPTAEVPKLDPVGPYDHRDPYVEPEGPEPFVELEGPEPVVELEDPEPVVSFEDRSEAGDYEDSEPLPELEVPEPLVELEREPSVELDEPQPERDRESPSERDRESPSERAHEEELTVKPIETVSAIDLVMQDAEERRPRDR